MIAYLEGRLLEVTGSFCVLLTSGGVGYEVFMPANVLAQLPEKGQSVNCHVCTVVREDALELYGFQSWDERQTFILLTSISKIGAKTALSVLSVFRPDDLRRLVLEDDINSLTRVPGIGKKTAQHVFLELKYKLKMDGADLSDVLSGAAGPSVLREAVTGLLNLGYAEDEAELLVKESLKADPSLDVAGALRAALKQLAKRK